MKIINLGSINIDHVYNVDHFVRPGETLKSERYNIFSGGKGTNQSIALARAGAAVLHAGKIGPEGAWLKEQLADNGVDTELVRVVDAPTGHAVIQVNPEGENAIIIHGGANRTFKKSDIDRVLERAETGDILLLQNETNAVAELLERAEGLTIVFNPAPMSDEVKRYKLEKVDLFIVNEVEGEALTGRSEPEAILDTMQTLYPQSRTVLTLGKAGVIYGDGSERIRVAARQVEAVDTTGAGDTFIGYFLAELARGSGVERCLEIGVRASAICVTRQGAVDSIPLLVEVQTKA